MLVATCAIELIPLHYHLWTYYGQQPLRIGGFPLWWAFINGHSFIASSVVLVLLLRLLPANRRFLLIPIMPAVVLAMHTGGAMIGYSTVSSTSDPTATWAGTLGAMAFTTLMCWIYSLVVRAKPAPGGAQTTNGRIAQTWVGGAPSEQPSITVLQRR
jgi:CDP-diglyceride synthetase